MKTSERPSRGKQGMGQIDWHAVKRRMEKAHGAIEHAWMPSAEEIQRVLMARAQALGRVPDAAETAGKHIDVVDSFWRTNATPSSRATSARSPRWKT